MADHTILEHPQTLHKTLGAVLLGSFVSVFLSGVGSMQGILYFRMFPEDRVCFRTLVSLVWLLDISHTVMVCITNWLYLIQNFGSYNISHTIVWSVAASIAITALLTFLVHLFFVHRIFSVSDGNRFVIMPIIILATGRLCFALLTTSKMIAVETYAAFVEAYTWSFTLGLSLATAADILITLSLCWYLNNSRTGFSSMDSIIDSITLYTIENGLVTTITTVIALICWLTMPHNLIFLGLHFAISKLYSNTFLATLNARKMLRSRSQGSRQQDNAGIFLDALNPSQGHSEQRSRRNLSEFGTEVHIRVEKTVQHDVVKLSDASNAQNDKGSDGTSRLKSPHLSRQRFV